MPKKLYRSALFRASLGVFSGNVANAVLSFLALTLLGRALGPTGYGLFTTAVAFLLLMTEMSDLGVNPSLIRFAAYFLQNAQPNKAKAAFAYALRFRVVSTVVISVLSYGLATPLAQYAFHDLSLAPLLRLAALGLPPAVALSYCSAVYQSHQRFSRHVLVNVLSGFCKLSFIAGLVFFYPGSLTPHNAIVAFALAPVAAVLLALFLDYRSILIWQADREDSAAISKEMRSFSLWMAVWAFFAILQGRLDQFMTTSMLGAEQAGYYAAAYQFASIFILMVGALGTVLNPRLAGYPVERLRAFFKRQYSIYAAFFLLVCAFIIGGNLLLPVLFGHTYVPALPLFTTIMGALFFFGCSTVPNSILNALQKPQIFSFSAGIGLVLTFLANLFFLPRYGLMGIGLTFTLVHSSSFIIGLLAAHYYLNKAASISSVTHTV